MFLCVCVCVGAHEFAAWNFACLMLIDLCIFVPLAKFTPGRVNLLLGAKLRPNIYIYSKLEITIIIIIIMPLTHSLLLSQQSYAFLCACVRVCMALCIVHLSQAAVTFGFSRSRSHSHRVVVVVAGSLIKQLANQLASDYTNSIYKPHLAFNSMQQI